MVISACENGSDDTPDNLNVEFKIEYGTGRVNIIAKADNALKYELWVENAGQPEETNTTGIFEYVFAESGSYELEVRAYGSSGEFITETIMVTITIPREVSVEDGYVTPLEYDGYQLVWNDEFDGDAVNTDYWEFETGTGCPDLCGWGNNELQYYRKENASVYDGVLTIEARKGVFLDRNYTSARMKTQGKKSFKYGRIDIRALLPEGQGIWPALWMLGENITTVGWPRCGEIDIMELIGGSGRENEVHGTLHWDHNGHVYTGGSYTLQIGTFADEYHVFSIIWDETSIRWFVNDQEFNKIDITPDHMTEFHHEFFFVFNVAVGGNWPGDPDYSTIFPQSMKVDYVRVFKAVPQMPDFLYPPM